MSQRVSQTEPKRARVRQKEPESERVSQSEPECASESQRASQREPENELEGLRVSFRVILGPNLGCQSQPRQCDLENLDFPCVFDRFI